MMHPLPWKIDDMDCGIIRDNDGEIIAENYKFIDLDDFEGLVKLVNLTINIKRGENK